MGGIIVAISGCAAISHYQELMTLKRLGKNKEEIDRYVEDQKKRFAVLVLDIKNNVLLPGLSWEYIIQKYGEPVIVKDVTDKTAIKQVILYRHPTAYFTSDKVYFYFSKDKKLIQWQYQPGK